MDAARLPFPVHGPGSGSEWVLRPALTGPVRGLSRRFNSRCSRALPPIEGRESNPFAVVGPECRTRGRRPRATGASLLVAPAVLGVCEGGSKSIDGPRGENRSPRDESERRRALLPSLPLASLTAEGGGSAPCTATADVRAPRRAGARAGGTPHRGPRGCTERGRCSRPRRRTPGTRFRACRPAGRAHSPTPNRCGCRTSY